MELSDGGHGLIHEDVHGGGGGGGGGGNGGGGGLDAFEDMDFFATVTGDVHTVGVTTETHKETDITDMTPVTKESFSPKHFVSDSTKSAPSIKSARLEQKKTVYARRRRKRHPPSRLSRNIFEEMQRMLVQ